MLLPDEDAAGFDEPELGALVDALADDPDDPVDPAAVVHRSGQGLLLPDEDAAGFDEPELGALVDALADDPDDPVDPVDELDPDFSAEDEPDDVVDELSEPVPASLFFSAPEVEELPVPEPEPRESRLSLR